MIRKLVDKVLAAVIMIMTAGCGDSGREIIDKAEDALTVNADSALNVLSGLLEPEKLEDPDLSDYWIVTGQAHSNNGTAMTGDSMLCHALEYYSRIAPDSAKRLRALYLTAKHYWWKGYTEKAYNMLDSALKECRDDKYRKQILLTLSEMTASNGDFKKSAECTAALISSYPDDGRMLMYRSNIATIKYYDDDTGSAIKELESIGQYAKNAQDSAFMWKYSKRALADIQSDVGRQTDAIKTQNEILSHYRHTGDSTEISVSYASLARYHLLLGDINAAKRCMAMADSTKTSAISNDLSWAGYYTLMHAVLDYAGNRNIKFKDWALFVNGLQDNNERRQKIGSANDEARRLLAERNLRLAISRQRSQNLATWIGLAAIVSVAVFVVVGRRRKQILENRAEEIDALRRMVAEARESGDAKDDRFFKKVLLRQLGVIRMAAANPTVANQEMLRQMTEIANNDVAVDSLLDWDTLYRTIDYVYDNYHSSLREKYGDVLNEKEMQLCCLLRANFSTKEISIVTRQGVRTVYQRKTVIRQKLGIEEKGDIVAATLA